MTTMIERVARIVELAIVRHGVPETDLEGTLDDANAIFEAMREPTAKVRVAGIEAAYREERHGAPLRDSIPTAFAAMITAALSEDENKP